MKKLFCVLLTLFGIGAVLYLLTQRNPTAQQLWAETLAKVPGGCCCSGADCAGAEE